MQVVEMSDVGSILGNLLHGNIERVYSAGHEKKTPGKYHLVSLSLSLSLSYFFIFIFILILLLLFFRSPTIHSTNESI